MARPSRRAADDMGEIKACSAGMCECAIAHADLAIDRSVDGLSLNVQSTCIV
jgi:hypothetical protein